MRSPDRRYTDCATPASVNYKINIKPLSSV